MGKYILILILLCIALFSWAIHERDNRITYENNYNSCLREKENYKNAQISSNKLIKELREEVSKNNNSMDCYNSPMPDSIRELLLKLK